MVDRANLWRRDGIRSSANIRLALIAIGVAAVALGYARVQGSVAKADGVGVSPERAQEVQVEIQRARLPQRLEAAMGDGFGGVWYERQTAQLHVGITSVFSRIAAEAVAAESGLAADLTMTPVHSTWSEVRAEQERLSRHLSGLFAQAQVSTGLRPQENAVHVELASSVSAARRSEVKAEASASGVNVLVDAAPSPHLRIHTQACKPFVNKEALCDPPIVSGVSIANAAETKECTAGPAVILENPAKSAEAEETFLLTAGHCFIALGEKWNAFTNATPSVPKELGPAVESLYPETDIGVIRIVKGSYWLNPQPIPVSPSVAPWKEKKPVPIPIVGHAVVMVGNRSCFSGHTSGTECGEVEEVGVEETIGGKTTKELARVKGALSFDGDSGGPWFAESSPGLIEGTHMGLDGKFRPLFQPLEVSLEKLKKYVLLTTTNQARDLGDFVSSEAEAAITSTADGTGKTAHHVIELDSGVLTCSGASFEGIQSGKEAIELTVTPTYKECLFNGSSVSVSTGGCAYGLHASREFEIKSRAGKNCATEPIKVEFASCKIEIPPQGERASLSFHDIKPGTVEEVTMEMSLKGITYKATGAGCPKAGEFSNGAYTTGNTILTGAKPGGGAMVNYRWVE